MTVRPIANMVNHETNEVFFDDLEIPAENLIGEEGQGFRYILDGLNAERTLIAAECIGDGYWFVDTARRTRTSASCSTARSAATRACNSRSPRLHRARGREPDALSGLRVCSTRSEPAAPKPTWRSTWPPRRRGRRPTCACRRTAASASPAEYDVERKFRETRLYQVAPISTNLILSYVAEHVLGCRGRSEHEPSGPSHGHHRRLARTRDRRAVRDAPARGPRRARHQDRAARRRRLRAGYDERVHGMASHFVWINRGKESLTLDLKQRRGDRRAEASSSRRPTCWSRTSRPAPRRGWGCRPRRCGRRIRG